MEIIHKEVNPDQLEKLIAWYFKKIGANEVINLAKNVPKDNQEADADVTATFEALKVRIHIQVKHHQGETDDLAVSQIKAYKGEREKIAETDYDEIYWVISTCDIFSAKAHDAAVEASVRLIDGQMFAKMLIDAGLEDLHNAFGII